MPSSRHCLEGKIPSTSTNTLKIAMESRALIYIVFSPDLLWSRNSTAMSVYGCLSSLVYTALLYLLGYVHGSCNQN